MKTDTQKNPAGEDLGKLEPAVLLEAATLEADLDDFGDMGFVEPLTRLMHALVTEANLNQMGLLGTRTRVIQCLVNRLRVQQAIKQHPEILHEDVSDPIVIIGLPRTGTTKLQRMMSSDPAVQKTPYWQLLNPAPLPGCKRGEPDGRIALAQAGMDAMAQLQPDFLATHPMGAEEIDEDVFMMDIAFEGILPLVQYHVPSFEAWVLKRSRQYFYAYEKILLQYLQWQNGGRCGPWVLKATTHFGGIETLIDIFPGATFVHCHRDVATSVASMIRGAEGFRGLMASLDLAEIASDYLRIESGEISVYLQQRERLGSRLNIVDASYDDIVTDPMKAIRSVYAARGLALTPEGERAMLGWEKQNPQYRHGKLSYSLERYGLTEERVEEAFGAYQKKFAAML